jgi:glycosyltransferase involved in cell wall biosynthesis
MRLITRLAVGGPAIQATILNERLDPERFESLLVVGTPGPSEGDMLDLRFPDAGKPIQLESMRREISPVQDLFTLVRILAIMWKFRPDIVHTHNAKAGALGRLAAWILRVPVIVHTFHGSVFRGHFGETAGRFALATERLLARLSTAIVAISEQQSRDLRDLGIAQDRKLKIIPLGFDLEMFKDATRGSLRRELGIDDSVPLVGVVGRFVPVKGLDVFLETARRVGDALPNAHFVMVGDGVLRSRLEALVDELGLRPRMHFLGWRADVASIFKDLDVLVLTSHSEGTPVSIIEALATGTPVVATAVGGVRDLLGESTYGETVDRVAPEPIAAAVLRVLSDLDTARSRARAAQERVLSVHSATRLIRDIEQLYVSLHVEAGRAPARVVVAEATPPEP